MAETLIGIIGSGNPAPENYHLATEVGRLLGRQRLAMVCGGMGGVMEAASRGCHEEGGTVIGLLPGPEASEGNDFLTYALPTNLGHARNVLIAHAATALIAIEGEYGTLSEIAVSLKLGRTVVGLNTSWDIPGLLRAENAEHAVSLLGPLLEGKA